jgi:phage head maturation protease
MARLRFRLAQISPPYLQASNAPIVAVMATDLAQTSQEILSAAEKGDRLAFAALAQRFDTLEEAQALVRDQAFMRMAERGAVPRLALKIREATRGDTGDTASAAEPTLYGHFAVFNEWTEIDSMFEGHFLERIAPGAFKKTFREQTPKVTFQHGHDPFLGDKILGKTDVLEEDAIGARYEVPLFRGLPELLMDGLRADQYGASFRFRTMREEFVDEPDPSEDNPRGLPERTLKELHVPEFGPVTFPAYPSATAGVRSANGDGEEVTDAPSTADAAADAHSGDTRRRAVNGTSGTERRESTPYTWQSVLQERY